MRSGAPKRNRPRTWLAIDLKRAGYTRLQIGAFLKQIEPEQRDATVMQPGRPVVESGADFHAQLKEREARIKALVSSITPKSLAPKSVGDSLDERRKLKKYADAWIAAGKRDREDLDGR